MSPYSKLTMFLATLLASGCAAPLSFPAIQGKPETVSSASPAQSFAYRIDPQLLDRFAGYITRVYDFSTDHPDYPDDMIHQPDEVGTEVTFFKREQLTMEVRFDAAATAADFEAFARDYPLKAGTSTPQQPGVFYWVHLDAERITLEDLPRLASELGLKGTYLFSSETLARVFQEYLRLQLTGKTYKAAVGALNVYVSY